MIKMPEFSQLVIDQIETDLDVILAKNQAVIASLSELSVVDWATLMLPLENCSERLHHFWSRVSHLHSVNDSPELRAQYDACLPKLSAYYSELGQSKVLYDAVISLKNSNAYHELSQAQKSAIDHMIRDFKLSGVHLDAHQQKCLRELFQDLSQTCNQFSQNVLDATQSTFFDIEDVSTLDGLPAQAKNLAKSRAEAAQVSGYRLTIDGATWVDVMTYATHQALRKKLYTAYVTRASDQGPLAEQYNNQANMEKILSIRTQIAHLLGFKHYADYSLATKMLKKSADVMGFLDQLSAAAKGQAQREFSDLQHFAAEALNLKTLEAWDIAYASEQYRQHLYHFSDEMLRPYFEIESVISGLFSIVERLFDVHIKPIKSVDTWHKDVKAYMICDANQAPIAAFYMDLLARPNKRSGAWMDDCQSRRRLPDGRLQHPIAFINTNFSPAPDGDPILLSHDSVVTLFHEFGHGLQHMLTIIDFPDVAGINGIPWDAVEIASQWLENFAWQSSCLQTFAKHHQSQKPLPDDLFKQMKKAQHFQSALRMVRQLEFSLFDFSLHMKLDQWDGEGIQRALDDVRQQVAVIKAPSFNRFQHSFAHIFAGGYAAGYYSYQWAEVMAQDVFSIFLRNGLFDSSTASRFRSTFLAQGGAREVMDLFVEFCERKPSVEALLKHSEIGPE